MSESIFRLVIFSFGISGVCLFLNEIKDTKDIQNQVWNLLHKLVVQKGELILISGSKATIFLSYFVVAPKFHSKFSQKFKNRGFKNFSQKMAKKF